MARLRDSESVEGGDHSTVLRDSSQPASVHPSRGYHSSHASQSPSPSQSSDKENQEQTARAKSNMGPPPLPTPQSRCNTLHIAKKRRLGDVALQDQSTRSRSATEEPDQFYDPNQDIDERRRIRKGLRDLNKEAADLRTEWMAPESNGLVDAVVRANSLFHSVKQTSDATIDSRLLVTAGDLTYKKTQQVSVGDGSQGIDVEEFVSKCITFMRQGDEDGAAPTNAQRQRRRAATEIDSDDEGQEAQDNGDALNWEWFGARACFPVNSRPPVPGFLLGPLSVQKRARAQTQRRQHARRVNPEDAVKPQELHAADLQQQENTNLTKICQGIHHRLGSLIADGERQVQEEVDEDASESEVQRVMDKHNITSNAGIPLFRFAINPKSFGQTVENLFYVSFLIREGAIGIEEDDKQMPTLHHRSRATGDQKQDRRRDAKRHQAVFSLDFETWKELVDVFKIEKSLIPHRAEEEAQNVSATGWYG